MTSTELPPASAPARRRGRPTEPAGGGDVNIWFFVKLALIALVDALGVYILWQAFVVESWWILVATAVALVGINWVYFARRAVPAKYLVPGLLFLLVYQVFTIVYTGYVSFTNYGQGHNDDKQAAIEEILEQNEFTLPDSVTYAGRVVERGEGEEAELGLAIVDDAGEVRVGFPEEPAESVEGATLDENGLVEAVPDARVVPQNELYAMSAEVTEIRVPFSEDPNDGSLRTRDGRNVTVATPRLVHDEDADTMTNRETGVVYTPNDTGNFESDDGDVLTPGWYVLVGPDNYVDGFSDSRYAGPLFKVLVWTIVFAFLSVATTFLLGLFLAVVFNDPRVRGQKIYRTLLILPYAFPGFLAALLWSGLLNERFGFINNVLLFGSEVPWLTDPWLAKLSVIGVNLWLGFPYMFLVCTGALQAIPGDVKEAARIDGASGIQMIMRITMPLLLVAVGPLLIASYGFNFNNFSLIFLLTEGGPFVGGAQIGGTDLLITYAYRLAFAGAAPNYGLAAAVSIIIFALVALMSLPGFRATKKLEEIG